MKTTLFAAAMALAGSAFSAVLYVTPEAPPGSDGSGSSWANAMTNLTDACAAAAGGGEVWIKTGIYYVTNSTPMYSGMKVLGGFSGDETDASEADPESNPVILTNDPLGNNEWTYYATGGRYYATGVKVREGLTINPPPDSPYDGYVDLRAGYPNPFSSCFSDASGSLEDVEISGLVFCTISCEAVSVGPGSRVTVSDCRFVACNSYQEHAGAIIVKGPLTLINCAFTGCNYAVNFAEGSFSPAGAESVVSNCLFSYCAKRANGLTPHARSSTISFRQSASLLKVSGCTFYACNDVGDYMCKAGSSFEDNVVERCRARTYYYNMDIVRCVYRDNDLKAGTVSDSLGLVDLNGDALNVRDTMFLRNSLGVELDAGVAANRIFASCVTVLQNSNHPVFLNCSFVSNTVSCASTPFLKAGTVSLLGSGSSRSVSFINCAFRDNSGGADLACVPATGSSNTNSIGVVVVNTVFKGRDAGSVPFDIAAGIVPGFYGCAAVNCDPSAIPVDVMSPVAYLSAVDPKFGRVRKGKNGVWAQTLASDTPCGKNGFAVYTSAGGGFWLRDENIEFEGARWKNLRKSNRAWSWEVNLPEIVMSVPPDAFGNPRDPAVVALGPVNPGAPGFSLLLK